MKDKLIVYKYSPINGLYIGFEEAIPHPQTGEFQIPFYTTKLVPPDKRLGFHIVFEEKEKTLPGQGIGTWVLKKEENKIYFNKETKECVTFSNLDKVDLDIYTIKNPNKNKYNIPLINEIFYFSKEVDEWEIDLENLKFCIIQLLKKSRNYIISQKIEYKNILFDLDEKARKNITDYALRFSVKIDEQELFEDSFKLELDTLKNINIIPWIDANNQTKMISPNTIIGLNYMIGFKELIVYSIYNQLRTGISEATSIEDILKILPNLSNDLEKNIILEFINIEFTEKFILDKISNIAEDFISEIIKSDITKEENEEEVDKVIPKIEDNGGKRTDEIEFCDANGNNIN